MPPDSHRPFKLSFFGSTAVEFDQAVQAWGWPRFRAQQVRDWVYGKLIADPSRMSNLSKKDQHLLQERVIFTSASIAANQRSSDGTQKLLLTWGEGPEQPGAAPPPQRAALDPAPTPNDNPEEPDRPGPAPAETARLSLQPFPAQPPVPARDPGFSTAFASAETVMIPDGDRRTACVSSQVGCPVGCKFCASGINGVKGNLTAAQIVEQVWQLNRVIASGERREGMSGERHEDTKARRHEEGKAAREDGDFSPVASPQRRDQSDGANPARTSSDPSCLRASVPPCLPPRVTNIVFMGMGEPLANYSSVMKAVQVLHDPRCFNLGARRITISTVGVPARMRQLAGEQLPLNLAISLHAPNEPLRKQLIPWAEHFALDDILAAARHYFDRTGREVTLEYILLSGVNDRPDHARELARLCKTMRANVNLIRYNEVAGLPYLRPRSEDVVRFQEILRRNGVNAHVRKSRGRDIDAACGQLRRKQQEREPALTTPGVPAR